MKTIILILMLFFPFYTIAQNFDIKWQFDEKSKSEIYKDQQCFNLNGGTITAEDVIFHNGRIEYDVCIQPGRGFTGVRFRDDQKGNTEEFYIRKHQSGNPDAMQYTPVFNGNAGWQLYYGDGYSAMKEYPFDQWFHIKIIINGTRGEVYIEDMSKPVLAMHELKMGNCKGSVSFYGPARYANIKIEAINSPELLGTFREIKPAGTEVIKKYHLSKPIRWEDLIKSTEITENLISDLKFQEVDTEADGVLNISKYNTLSREKNTALIQINITSEMNQTKALTLGFSDAAKIFLNGKAIWLGIDTYRSRDYRFLGTVGYFDTVYLNLVKGENVVTIAVAENFGGWGIKTKLDNLDGIIIK